MDYLREEALELYLVGTNKSTALKVRNMTRGSVPLMTYQTNLESLFIPIVMGLLFLLGIIGNITVIYTVARHRSMHSVPNIYIVNIAIGDLLLLVIALPFQATIFTLKEWVFGEITCKISEFLQPVSLGVTAFTLAVLCADRHAAWAGNPRYYLLARTRKLNIVVNTVIVWTVALAMGVPDLVSSYIMHYPINKDLILKVCSVFPPTWGALYPIIHDTVWFSVLLALSSVICWVYLLLISILICSKGYQVAISDDVHYRPELDEKSKSDSKEKDKRKNGSSRRHPKGKRSREERERQKRWTKQRKNSTLVVTVMLVMFIFCCLPRYIFQLWFHFDKQPYNMFWYIMKLVGFCLNFGHAVVNPFVLCALDDRFSEHFKRYWLYGCSSAKKRIALMQQLVNTSESSEADETETTVKTQPDIYEEAKLPNIAPRYQTMKRPAPIYNHYPDDVHFGSTDTYKYPYVQDDVSTFAIYI
ncbi:neuropeptide CCHamide-1 receptor isoform X2 [Lingula anatina]|uniref:Neuropeptide CCHamide-1 receptor isoform X2 n=1 Tax=Lingula anatina TaxID=7574 RepID=A0A1S3H6Q1_LINAN|nr:neuropeptide CCHamide-1 receptor isoform X2 [Lingula anatina]|eukprot:XP_013381657.1 neuropeptide CCHamide-1 receptor isoform X2 [Lingula anatina]